MTSEDNNDHRVFDMTVDLVDRLSALPTGQRLMAVELAWVMVGMQARQEALAIPGGFQAERERQLEHLGKLAWLVREDTPDLELERLMLEGDVEGLARHLSGLSVKDHEA